jgi:hypothetical protein
MSTKVVTTTHKLTFEGKTYPVSNEEEILPLFIWLLSSQQVVRKPRVHLPLLGYHPIPIRSLKWVFNKAVGRNPDLNRFLQYFTPDPSNGFHVLTQGNSNYPSAYCSADEFGNLVINYQFNDVKKRTVYVKVTFPKDREYYYVPNVEFIARLDGENQVFTIDIDDSLFNAGFKLTKKQVLNFFFRCLGELALIMFFDYFVDSKLQGPYDKLSIINRFVRRISEKFEISFDKKARKINIGKRVTGTRTEREDSRTNCDVTSFVALFWYIRRET